MAVSPEEIGKVSVTRICFGSESLGWASERPRNGKFPAGDHCKFFTPHVKQQIFYPDSRSGCISVRSGISGKIRSQINRIINAVAVAEICLRSNKNLPNFSDA